MYALTEHFNLILLIFLRFKLLDDVSAQVGSFALTISQFI